MNYKSNSIKIQICSDIHLEEDNNLQFHDVITPVADYLILAGDICHPGTRNYELFLQQCSLHFQQVFIINGNHEYYSDDDTMQIIDNKVKLICENLKNVTFLDKSEVEVGNYVIIGCTLWSFIPAKYYNDAVTHMNDFKYIQGMTVHNYNKLHQLQSKWLQDKIHSAQNQGKKLIVITHHPPSMNGTSLLRYSNDPLRFCYKNNMDHLISMPCIAAWICGHTHFSFCTKRGKTLFLSNQYRSKIYKSNFTIEV